MSSLSKTPMRISKQFKLIFLGAWNSGKTSIIRRYCADQFLDKDYPIEFFTKEIIVPSAKVSLTLSFWDTEEQERLRPLCDIYYQNADAAIIVFDITSKESEEEANGFLLELVKKKSIPKVIVTIANKADLIPDADKISEELRLKWKSKATFFMTTSAKTGQNINELFEQLAVIIYKEECYEGLKIKELIKALVLGDKGVGKTSMIERFSLRTFSNEKIGVGSKIIPEAECKAKYYDLQLLDTDTEEYFQINKNNVDAFVIVYDLNLVDPLLRIKWIVSKIRKARPGVYPILLIGNKLDLLPGPVYRDNQLMAFIKSEKLLHKIVSAKNGFGFTSVFENLIHEVIIHRGSTNTQTPNTDPKCKIF